MIRAFVMFTALLLATSVQANDENPSKEIQSLVNDLAVGCVLSKDSNGEHCRRANALRKMPLTPDELMCIHKFANWARRETHDGKNYPVDTIFMLAAVSGKCAVR